MAKEPSSAESSLRLHDVLESEFVALHGKLPADYPDSTKSETRLKAFCAAVHGLKEKRAALCISGGGIRSATFGLGVLQGLARCGLLGKFHYLSTVSGGGYIGSWLSAWIKNHPRGIRGVVEELKRRPDSIVDPESRPIRHLREFSNYLTPRLGLTSADSWTLIATFIRNMFLNWLVLISLLAACMMIPRLYLAAINLQPDWLGRATLHSWQLLANNLPPDWNAWTDSVKQAWDRGLTILLAVGFALIAFAMAYAFIDVPSTGNARLSQRRFLIYRQLPLFLASLILAAWWAVFFNVHGDEPFRAADWRVKFVVFFVLTYVCGGLLGKVVLSFRQREQKAPGGVWRFIAIVVVAGFAGLCL
jgi:patatin-like phospholipase